MSLALSQMGNDPIFREQAERARVARKREEHAAALRAGPSPADVLVEAAEQTLATLEKPTETLADETTVDVDVDVDLVGMGGLADAHRRGLDEAIGTTMEAGFGDLLGRLSPEFRGELLARDDVDPEQKRRFAGRAKDRARVAAELRASNATPLSREAVPEPELTGEALIQRAAEADLARLLAPKQRGQRR